SLMNCLLMEYKESFYRQRKGGLPGDRTSLTCFTPDVSRRAGQAAALQYEYPRECWGRGKNPGVGQAPV
ncbi:MAG: hypothetical protein QNL96_06215, partial [SAR86 cluster bacterium]